MYKRYINSIIIIVIIISALMSMIALIQQKMHSIVFN